MMVNWPSCALCSTTSLHQLEPSSLQLGLYCYRPVQSKSGWSKLDAHSVQYGKGTKTPLHVVYIRSIFCLQQQAQCLQFLPIRHTMNRYGLQFVAYATVLTFFVEISPASRKDLYVWLNWYHYPLVSIESCMIISGYASTHCRPTTDFALILIGLYI